MSSISLHSEPALVTNDSEGLCIRRSALVLRKAVKKSFSRFSSDDRVRPMVCAQSAKF